MRPRLRWAIPVIAVGAGLLAVSAGSQRVRIKDAGAVEAEAVVVDLSLGLFSDLAKVKAGDPSVVERLLGADPREPAKVLKALGIDFETFRKQVVEGASVRPLVLFLRHGADPVEEARRRGITIVPWPPQAPPALLAGRDLDTLIVFESLTTSLRPRPGTAVARDQVASLAELRAFALAEGPSSGPIDIRRYWIDPQRWKKAVVFEHTRCEERGPGMTLVTKLTYEGGSTDSSRTTVADASWSPCKLVNDPGLEAVLAKQESRKKAGRGAIVASSYFRAPAGPVLSRIIEVD